MKTPIKYVLIGSMALGLAACADSALKFNSEAGAFLDEGGFGNPTMINMMAQVCSSQGKGFKGSIVGDPIVTLESTGGNGQTRHVRNTRIRCSDHLNGKYAEVIFREYVESATAVPVGNELTEVASE
jgi:hypothetical protein